jgi:hypothetical protein
MDSLKRVILHECFRINIVTCFLACLMMLLSCCNIEDKIKARLENTRFNQGIVTAEDVCVAVSKLKAHKHEGDSELSSDHIINAGSDLMIHTACLFSAAIIHGTAPVIFLPSTVIPIPKGRNVNLTISDNYRGIAVSSIFCKIFDVIVLERYQHQLASYDLQFGFKRNSSTNLCSTILKETLSYYVNNHSPVLKCVLYFP